MNMTSLKFTTIPKRLEKDERNKKLAEYAGTKEGKSQQQTSA